MPSSQDFTRFVCLFHDASRARAAVRALESLDGLQGAVEAVGGDTANAGIASTDRLAALGVPERDRAHLEDGLRHGGVLVSLEAAESRSGEIEGIFHKYSAGKIDETELDETPEFAAAPAAAAALPFAAAEPAVVPPGAETVIPIAEEELVVGKREVDRGGVRVFRHTVEQPVSQDVDLHGERVVLAYREVDRPATEADIRAGAQEIELVETAEVPVVQKVARVVEEVHVGKVETDRTETVTDNVRHTEVEVEPLDTVTGRPGTGRL